MRVYGLFCDGKDELAFVIIDNIQVLQCGDHIFFLYAGHLRDFTEKKHIVLIDIMYITR